MSQNLASGWAEIVGDASERIRTAGQWREIRTLACGSVRTNLNGNRLVHFASNDYFGLSQHPRVVAAAVAATQEYGAGSSASRLVVGSRAPHDRLEELLAEYKSTEACLLFPTGYAANLGVIGALARLGSVGVVSDALNHASLIDGCRLSRVPTKVAAHCDLVAVARLVAEVLEEGRRPVVVTESVFSMDGDATDLVGLADVCVEAGALLVIDDAHGVFGQLPTWPAGLEVLIVGTLSKSLGSLGGFVAGSSLMISWIRNVARSFIFTTAPTPAAAAAASEAVTILRSEEGFELQSHLRSLVDVLVPGHPSAVIPVVVGAEAEAVALSSTLLEREMLVPAIRPPTVPRGTSRLRVALSAAHRTVEVEALRDALEEFGFPPSGPTSGGEGPTASWKGER